MTTEPTHSQHRPQVRQRSVARHVADLRRQPVAHLEVAHLELAVFEGRGRRSTSEHVRAHSGSRAVCVDASAREHGAREEGARERPKLALDAVRRALRDRSTVLFRDEPLGLRRTPPPARAPRPR